MTLPSTVFCRLFIKLKHIQPKKRDLFHGSSSLYCRSDHRADFFLQYFWCEHCRVFHRLGKERYFRFITQHCFTGSHFQFRDLKYSSAYLHKKRKDCMMSFLVRFLIVFSVNFEISLRVITYRAYFWSCCTDNDMSAVAAFPYLDFALFEDFLCFYILE